jgi:hypothetical protein
MAPFTEVEYWNRTFSESPAASVAGGVGVRTTLLIVDARRTVIGIATARLAGA